RIKKTESDDCAHCQSHGRHVPETVHHFLFDCPAYIAPRHRLVSTLGRDARNQRALLGTKKGITALLHYVASTKRLVNIFGDVSVFRPAYLEK
ncbi:hypothetical protein BD626DRAFT_413110, partial [Schizophyllum amplum]